MNPASYDPADPAGGSRSRKPRPQPLDLPRDVRYGTMDTRASGGPRDSRQQTRASTETAPLWNYISSPHSPLVKIRDHCHQQWVAVVLTLLLLAITFYFVFGLSAPMRADQCVTPFGTLLGESSAIGAYSNCRHTYGGDMMDHFVSVGLQRLYTGSKWHALEYARRYWVLTSLLTFPSLPTPEHLIGLRTATSVNGRRGGRGSSAVVLERFLNLFVSSKFFSVDEPDLSLGNLTGEPNNVPTRLLLTNPNIALPVPRDLVVYSRNKKTLPEGHVAVVVAVRGPFRTVAAAGRDVHWYRVKNASSNGRQPLGPESKVPHDLLSKAKASAAAADAAAGPITYKGQESVADGTSVRYYKVYVAEQNWNNDLWKSARSLVEEQHAATATSANASEKHAARLADEAATRRRGYSRVLLLHEYTTPHGFFLEDTHNNQILGWIRAPNDLNST